MNVKEIRTVGVIGVNVHFNNTELVVLKSKVQELKAQSSLFEPEKNGSWVNKEFHHQDIMVMSSIVGDILLFFDKILPKDVMSLADAEIELFVKENKDELVNEETEFESFPRGVNKKGYVPQGDD